MKRRVSVKIMAYILSILMCVSMLSSASVSAAKKPKLSTKKITMKVGQTRLLKLKNAKKAVWKVLNGKNRVSLSAKTKKGVKIRAKKAGTAVVEVVADKKPLVCTVVIKKKPSSSDEDEDWSEDDDWSEDEDWSEDDEEWSEGDEDWVIDDGDYTDPDSEDLSSSDSSI